MMFKILLISAFIVASGNAEWIWKNNENDNKGDRYPRMTFPSFPTIPPLPQLPGFNFPNFPPINIPQIQIPQIQMPKIQFPPIQIPKMPTKEEMLSQNKKGYQATIIEVIDGKTTITKNKDGVTTVYTDPPQSKE